MPLPGNHNGLAASRPAGAARAPAVIVGATGACGLGLVRSLSHAGIPVIVVDTNAAAPAMHSRYGRKAVVSALSGRALIDDLLTLRARLETRPVLFLTSDEAALAVSAHRAELQDSYQFRLPRHERLVSLMHKSSFHEFAQAHGFPVPRSASISGAADFACLAEFRFPCLIKPAVKSEEYYRRQFERGYKVDSVEEAEAVCRRILPVLPDLVIQEWIEGPPSELYFCLQYRGDQETVCSFTGRKISIWPRDVGMTASCTAAPDADAILRPLTDAFFNAVSFVGMGSMEFKRDVRTGEFLMIEPTVGRVDWQEEVATLHGANIPLAAYLYECGEPIPAITPLGPFVWRDPLMHWKSRRAKQAGQEPVSPGKVRDAYWRLDDPMPTLFHLRGAVKRLLHKAAASRPVPPTGRAANAIISGPR